MMGSPANKPALAVFGSLIFIIVYVAVGKTGLFPLTILPIIAFSVLGPGWGVFLGFRALREIKKSGEGRPPGRALALATIAVGLLILLCGLAALGLFGAAIFTMH